jgi:hypothetical protein
MGGTADRPHIGPESKGSRSARGRLQGAGDHRRARRRQDHPGARHSPHSDGEGVQVALCGRARCQALIGEHGAERPRTIHRSLETDPRTGNFKRDEERPLDCDLLVLDEASMVDVLYAK